MDVITVRWSAAGDRFLRRVCTHLEHRRYVYLVWQQLACYCFLIACVFELPFVRNCVKVVCILTTLLENSDSLRRDTFIIYGQWLLGSWH